MEVCEISGKEVGEKRVIVQMGMSREPVYLVNSETMRLVD